MNSWVAVQRFSYLKSIALMPLHADKGPRKQSDCNMHLIKMFIKWHPGTMTTECNKDINHLHSILTLAPISRKLKQRKRRRRSEANERKKMSNDKKPSVLKFVHLHTEHTWFKAVSIHILSALVKSEKERKGKKHGKLDRCIFQWFFNFAQTKQPDKRVKEIHIYRIQWHCSCCTSNFTEESSPKDQTQQQTKHSENHSRCSFCKAMRLVSLCYYFCPFGKYHQTNNR